MKRTTKHVALDVHQATTLASVREDSGRVIARTILPTEEAALLEFFGGMRGTIHVALEEGTQAQWLHDLLAPLVARVVVCDRRGEPRQGNKGDQGDADRLSELLWRGSVRAVYHGSAPHAALKELTRAYQNLVEDATRVMLRLKALFRARAIPTPGTLGSHHCRSSARRLKSPFTRSGLRVGSSPPGGGGTRSIAVLCRLARERASPFALPSPARSASTRCRVKSVLDRRWRRTPITSAEPTVSKVNPHPPTCPLRGVRSRTCTMPIGVDSLRWMSILLPCESTFPRADADGQPDVQRDGPLHLFLLLSFVRPWSWRRLAISSSTA